MSLFLENEVTEILIEQITQLGEIDLLENAPLFLKKKEFNVKYLKILMLIFIEAVEVEKLMGGDGNDFEDIFESLQSLNIPFDLVVDESFIFMPKYVQVQELQIDKNEKDNKKSDEKFENKKTQKNEIELKSKNSQFSGDFEEISICSSEDNTVQELILEKIKNDPIILKDLEKSGVKKTEIYQDTNKNIKSEEKLIKGTILVKNTSDRNDKIPNPQNPCIKNPKEILEIMENELNQLKGNIALNRNLNTQIKQKIFNFIKQIQNELKLYDSHLQKNTTFENKRIMEISDLSSKIEQKFVSVNNQNEFTKFRDWFVNSALNETIKDKKDIVGKDLVSHNFERKTNAGFNEMILTSGIKVEKLTVNSNLKEHNQVILSNEKNKKQKPQIEKPHKISIFELPVPKNEEVTQNNSNRILSDKIEIIKMIGLQNSVEKSPEKNKIKIEKYESKNIPEQKLKKLNEFENIDSKIISKKAKIDFSEIEKQINLNYIPLKNNTSDAFRQFTETLRTSSQPVKYRQTLNPCFGNQNLKTQNARIFFKAAPEKQAEICNLLIEFQELKSTLLNKNNIEDKNQNEYMKKTQLEKEFQEKSLKILKEGFEKKVGEKEIIIELKIKEMGELQKELSKMHSKHKNDLNDISETNQIKFESLTNKLTNLAVLVQDLNQENVF